MNLEYYIAKRIHFRQDRKNISRPAVRIAIAGIALGLAVMWISIAVMLGFKQEIRNKSIGFGGHVRITNLYNSGSMEYKSLVLDAAFRNFILAQPECANLQSFASKPAMIKTDDAFQGVMVKGVGDDFSWKFFADNLKSGVLPNGAGTALQADTGSSNARGVPGESLQTDAGTALQAPGNEVLLSQSMAASLNLKLGDDFFLYFIQDNIRARKMKVSGIFQTYFEEYDKVYLLTDIHLIQQLNQWAPEEVAGYEVLLNDYNKMEAFGDKLHNYIYQKEDSLHNDYMVQTVREQNPQVFAWLDLLDMNVWVIIVLMLTVAGFNMISGLLILILERTTMIGILKSLGATNWSIRKIFLYHTSFLIAKGMAWGNLIGLLLCAIQYFTHLIPLDPTSYYTSFVPIQFNWGYILLLNLGTLLASLLMMVGPSYLIAKILPSKIIRYE